MDCSVDNVKKIEKLESEIKDISKKLVELNDELIGVKSSVKNCDNKYEKWQPKSSENAWFIKSDGEVSSITSLRNNFIVTNLIHVNNCFKTRKEAEY